MIYLYTFPEEHSDWIMMNDLYFNLNTANKPISESDIEAIKSIDNAIVTKDNHIQTKYGIGTLRNLSSGCKTYLNILKNTGRIVSAEECGNNVLEKIFQLDNVHIYMSRPERFPISDNTEICFNNKEIVMGKSGYERWWSSEYERRAQDDI